MVGVVKRVESDKLHLLRVPVVVLGQTLFCGYARFGHREKGKNCILKKAGFQSIVAKLYDSVLYKSAVKAQCAKF